MKKIILSGVFFLFCTSIFSQGHNVKVLSNSDGLRLTVDGRDFMVNGMNWDYFPIGTNFNYSLWNQPDDIIMSALDSEMGLLKNMGIKILRFKNEEIGNMAQVLKRIENFML